VNFGGETPTQGGPVLVNNRLRRSYAPLLVTGLVIASAAMVPVGALAPRVTAPKPVTLLKAHATYKSVTLNWTNPKKGTFSGLVVRRANGTKAPSSSKAGTFIANLGAAKNSVVDTKVAASTSYSYAVFAYKGSAISKGDSIKVTTSVKPLSGINVFANTGGYGFNYPTDVAFDGSHLWVTNYNNNTVTEMNSSNGSFVRTLANTPSTPFLFDRPQAILYADAMIWVVNPPTSVSSSYNGCIDEINPSTGALVKVLGTAKYTGDPVFNYPEGLVAVGSDIWVVNSQPNSSGSLTEFVASTGVQVSNVSGTQYLFDQPGAIVATGTKLWVLSSNADLVTEVNATNGSFVQTLSGGSYGFALPTAMASNGTDVWVTNQAGLSGNSVTEFSASTGDWIQTLSGGSYGFNHPGSITVANGHVYVGNIGVINATNGTTVTEFSASSGTWIQTLSGSSTYQFDVPNDFAFDGTNLWVTNQYGQSVTEFSAS
jgi:hypothetical protein